MKILYSTKTVMNEGSPSGQHVGSIIQHWKDQGHQVFLLHPGIVHRGPYLRDDYVSNLGLLWDKFSKDWEFGSSLAKKIKEKSYDLVYHRYTSSTIFPVIRAKLNRLPVVVEVNADLDVDIKNRWGNSRLMRKIAKTLALGQCIFADRVIAVSEGVAENIRSHPLIQAEKVAVVPNGADLEIFKPLDKVNCRDTLSMDQNQPAVVYAGMFQEYQGVKQLVESVRILVESGQSITAYVLGGGPEEQALKELVQKYNLDTQIVFAGWCSPEETARYLGACDICLAPYSRTALIDPEITQTENAVMKGSPLKIFTYLAAGRPVIASHFREAGKIVEDFQAGLAVPPDDPAALAAAVKTLLEDPERMRIMGENARREAEAGLGWEHTAKRIISIVEQEILR